MSCIFNYMGLRGGMLARGPAGSMEIQIRALAVTPLTQMLYGRRSIVYPN